MKKQQKNLFNDSKAIRSRLSELNHKEWLTLTEVAYILGRSRFWVHQKAVQGKIKAKQDKMKGNTKIYRIVNIKWLRDFIDELFREVPD